MNTIRELDEWLQANNAMCMWSKPAANGAPRTEKWVVWGQVLIVTYFNSAERKRDFEIFPPATDSLADVSKAIGNGCQAPELPNAQMQACEDSGVLPDVLFCDCIAGKLLHLRLDPRPCPALNVSNADLADLLQDAFDTVDEVNRTFFEGDHE